jgi:5,10-methylenetetrahydrofolate reductase
MEISFEMNPPKILADRRFDLALLKNETLEFTDRASKLIGLVKNIHVTDSVLGLARLSSVTAASLIMKTGNPLSLTCSVRVRDRNRTSLRQIVSDAILIGVKSLLILMGDDPCGDVNHSGLRPSEALKMLNIEKYGSVIKLGLALPSKIGRQDNLQSKLSAEPNFFVTQCIASISQLKEIKAAIEPHKIPIIACIMVPSEKNKKSAERIGLDWRGYYSDPVDFIMKAGEIAAEVLLTSPNNFRAGIEILERMCTK